MKTRQDYPLVMKPQHVAEVMGISKAVAYDVMELPGFPLIRIRKIRMVAREAFFHWLDQKGGEKNG